eukprot:11580773-Alexandrium_andersonii.AAC.1
MRLPAQAALRLPSAQAFRPAARPLLEGHLQDHPAFERHLRELMEGAPPGLSGRELDGLRIK